MTETRETCQAVADIAISKEIVRLRERCAELGAENESLLAREMLAQGRLNEVRGALLDSQNRLRRLLQRRG